MTSAQTIEKQEIDRQLKALRQRQQRLAELSEQEAKRDQFLLTRENSMNV